MTGAGTQPPGAQGLYDPRHEHDACGVGFVVDIKGRRSHAVIEQGLQVLINLQHRGACGCEANTRRRRRHPDPDAGPVPAQGDRPARHPAARPGQYGAGLVFLPRGSRGAPHDRVAHRARFSKKRIRAPRLARRADRQPPARRAARSRRAGLPAAVRRAAAGTSRSTPDPEADRLRFERKLYVIRKRIEHAVDRLALDRASTSFYIVSLSARTLIYKGMLTADQIEPMFPDLTDPDMQSALALVHQRFSTNTFPSWPLAHPVPLHRAQRRDQHAARQHQLDARARGPAAVAGARRRSREDPADHPRRRQRHGDVRQRARVPRHDRALAAARDPDDDPRAVGGTTRSMAASARRSTSTTPR